MSAKIYRNNAARQQAYRDRVRSARHAANRAAIAAAANHAQHQQPDPICLICVGHKTVTQNRIPATVKTHSILSDSQPKVTDCHRPVAKCLIAPEGEQATCERCHGHYGQNTVTQNRILVTVKTEGADSGNV